MREAPQRFNKFAWFLRRLVIRSPPFYLVPRTKRNEDDGRCETRDRRQKSETGRGRCRRKSRRNSRSRCRRKARKQNTRLHCESACNVFEKSRKQDNELTETDCSNCPTDVRMFSLMANPFLRSSFPRVKFETFTLRTVFSQISNKHITY